MINREYAPQSGPKAVLVVEDEVLIRLLICDCLREAGAKVVEAANATEALEYLKTDRQITVVFSDVRMPGMVDGLALARHIRLNYPHIKLLLTSGHLTQADVDQGTILLPKPYPLQKTTDTILQILGRTEDQTDV